MERVSLAKELSSTTYPGRGIVIGRTKDGKKAVTAYFIMGRSENSRNRVFVEDGEGIRTQAFDPSKLEDPSLIIYAPVRVLGNKTIVTNGDQTDTIYELMVPASTLPVRLTIPTLGLAASSCPITEPRPFTRLNTPLGNPTSSTICAKTYAFSGVS